MKKLKRAAIKKFFPRSLYSFVVIMMIFQPVASPSILSALASDEVASVAPTTSAADESQDPVEEPSSDEEVAVEPEEEALVEELVAEPDSASSDEGNQEGEMDSEEIVEEEAQNQDDTSDTTDETTEPVLEEPVTEENAPNQSEEKITPEAASTETDEERAVVPDTEATPEEEQSSEEDNSEVGVWHENEDGSMTIAVEEDVEYEYKDSGLKITFTKLPDNPGEITVKELTLTEEQRRELDALTTTAWDITSDMEDGTFAYELTLPKPKDQKNIEVKYAENVDELKDAKVVSSDDVEVKSEEVNVEADHFTVYVVVWDFDDLDTLADSGSNAQNLTKSLTAIGATIIAFDGGVSGFGDYAATANDWSGGYWQIEVDATGHKNLKVSSQQRSSDTGPKDFKVQYSLNSGADWSDAPSGTVTLSANIWSGSLNISLPSECDNQSSIYLRWMLTSNTSADNGTISAAGRSRIDNISVEGDAMSSAKAITSFTISDQEGETTIDESAHTIELVMPSGTDVTALIPTIAISAEAVVNPDSGVAQDFTNPVNYTVTAEDGSSQIYAVTVKIVQPAPVIDHVSFNPATGTLGIGQTLLVTFKLQGSTTPDYSGTAVVNDHTLTIADAGAGNYTVNYIVQEGDADILESDSPGIPVSVELWNQNHTAYTTDYGTHFADPGVDATRPECELSLEENPDQNGQYASDDNFYFNTNVVSTGGFKVVASPSDDNGIQKVYFPAISGYAGGDIDDATSPYESAYTWFSTSPPTSNNLITCFDNAGNTSTASFNILKDTALPLVSSVSLDKYFVKDGATINIDSTVVETGSGISSCHAWWSNVTDFGGTFSDLGDLGIDCDGSITVPAGAGTYYILIASSYSGLGDNVGNFQPSGLASAAILVDNTAPTTSDDTGFGGQTYLTSKTFTLTPTDIGGSGVADTKYCLADFPATCTPDISGNSVTATCAGAFCTKWIFYYSTDNAGNIGATQHSYNFNIINDSTPPVITSLVNPAPNVYEFNNSDVTVTWTVEDTESTISSSTGCGSTSVTTETTGQVITCSATSAGGTNSQSVTIKLDKTGPSASLVVTAGTLGLNDWYTSDVTVATSCFDSVSTIESYTSDQYQTTDTAGQVFNGQCTNKAGLSTDASPITIKLDKTNPTGSITDPASGDYLSGTVTINADAADEFGSGVSKVEFYHNPPVPTYMGEDSSAPYSFDWDTTSVSDGLHNLYIKVFDNAGNDSGFISIPVTVDNTAPTVTFVDPTPDDGLVTNDNDQTFRVNVDSDTEICKLYYGVVNTATSQISWSHTYPEDTNSSWYFTSPSGTNWSFPDRYPNAASWGNGWVSPVVYDMSSAFHGEQLNGSWVLTMRDNVGWDSGGISNINLVLNGTNYLWSGWAGIWDYHTTQVSIPVSGSGTGMSVLDMLVTENEGQKQASVDFDDIPDGLSTYYVECSDGAGNSGSSSNRTLTIDTTAPVITIIGTDLTIEVGSVYADAGANASDNYDGDITGSIVTVNSVNANAVGVYTVTYNVTDSNGNSAVEVTRTVTVVDTTLPVITMIGTDLTIEAGSVYADAGANASDNYDGDITGSIVTVNSVNANAVGVYTVTYNVTDSNGNSAVEVTRTVTVVDTTAPTLSANPPAGDYSSDQLVELIGYDAGSGIDKIYYTVNGDAPSSSSTEYIGAIVVDKDMTIKAIAYDNLGNVSDVLTAIYGIAPVISAETSSAVATSTATITWETDIPATSRVVYDTVSHPTLGVGANYGYAFSTTEDPNKVTQHSVTVSGLSSGITYYFRVISHGSPEAISYEQSFTTSAPASNDNNDDNDDDDGDNDDDSDDDDDNDGDNDEDGDNFGQFLSFFTGTDEEGNINEEENSKEESVTPEEQVQGVGTEEEMVAGEETTCKSWPLWLWVLIFLVFSLGSIVSTVGIKKDNAGRHFTWQLAGVAFLVVVWYLFDQCSYYKWFPIGIIIVGILSHLYYQMFKVKDNKIKTS